MGYVVEGTSWCQEREGMEIIIVPLGAWSCPWGGYLNASKLRGIVLLTFVVVSIVFMLWVIFVLSILYHSFKF